MEYFYNLKRVFEYQRIKFDNFSNTSVIREYYITMKNILESDSW